jgi:hypothetical protein
LSGYLGHHLELAELVLTEHQVEIHVLLDRVVTLERHVVPWKGPEATVQNRNIVALFKNIGVGGV